MDTKINGVSGAAQGADSQKKVLSIKDVKNMVARDLIGLAALVECLNDPDIQDVLALHLHGKYMNAKHKEELELQTDLKL